MIKQLNCEYERFEGISLTGESIEDCYFSDCAFIKCSFTGCELHRCTFADCTFDNCTVNELKAVHCQVRSADLANSRLVGINWNQCITPNQFSAPFSTITNCRLKYNHFMEMNLTKTDFSGCEIVESFFGECRLADSSFNSCKLTGTEFFKCDLSKADFRNADGYKIDITTSKLKGAHFSFPEVTALLGGLGIKIEY